MIKSTIFFPLNFSIKILKNSYFFLLLKNYENFIMLPLNNFFKINKFSHTLNIYSKLNNFFNNFNNFLYNYSSLNLKVIKFKGKGYKLTKKNNTLTFLFNFSHISYFTARNSILKKIYKNRFALINWNKLYLNKTALDLINLRFADIFTLNGFRLKRQKIWKKKGKTLSS